MSFNSIGNLFTVTTFGESHGEAIGALIDGCPANFELNLKYIQQQLDRRRPGQSSISSARNEADEFRIISGVFEGKTTGAPITILIENKDVKSGDYDTIKNFYRPSHADFVYHQKYGHYDYRGGGRSSARTTASIVAAGAIARQLLMKNNIHIFSYVSDIGEISMVKKYSEINSAIIDSNNVRCPEEDTASRMEHHINEIKAKGDTVGGVITCVVQGVPVGLGEPLFEKLNANIAKAMFSINAVKGVAFGDGFDAAKSYGSLQNDMFEKTEKGWHTTTNHSGGIQGGISNGMDIYFKVAFKPVATLMQSQTTATKSGEQQVLEPKGRHDACVVPRAVPIVDAATAIVILNHLLMHRSGKEF
jgi:chorismate synthase